MRKCGFLHRCWNAVYTFSNIEVLDLSCVWLIVWEASLPNKKGSINTWTTYGNERH